MQTLNDLTNQLRKLYEDQTAELVRQSETMKKLQRDFADFRSESRVTADLVRKLQSDTANQFAEIKYVQLQIENCAGCHGGVVEIESCRTANPCFAGVECRDTSSGMVRDFASEFSLN